MGTPGVPCATVLLCHHCQTEPYLAKGLGVACDGDTVACKVCSVLLPHFPSICDRDALSVRFSLFGLQFQECACVYCFANLDSHDFA